MPLLHNTAPLGNPSCPPEQRSLLLLQQRVGGARQLHCSCCRQRLRALSSHISSLCLQHEQIEQPAAAAVRAAAALPTPAAWPIQRP